MAGSINSFTTLKNAVANWLDRDDMGDAIDIMICLAEADIYRQLRIRPMETALSETIASGVVAVPSGYQELRYAYVDTNPVTSLEVQSPDWIHGNYPTRSADGVPVYIARDGDNFIFGPYPDSTYTIKGAYYASLMALSTSNETNWFTSNAPDLLLYGTLLHSAPYVGDDPRAALWSQAYETVKQRVERQDQHERWPRGMVMRAVAG